MNDMQILYDYIKTTYPSSISTIAECSKNENSVPLVEDTDIEAINFDEVTKNIFINSPQLSSVDALICKEKLYFIEFKGTNFLNNESDIETKYKAEIMTKLSDTLLTLNMNILPLVTSMSKTTNLDIILVLVIKGPAISNYIETIKGRRGEDIARDKINGLLKKYIVSPHSESKYYMFQECKTWFSQYMIAKLGYCE